METIIACRVCSSKNIVGFFDLGKQPLANSLPARPDEREDVYPLSLSYCRDCGLAQLNETVPPGILFSQYVWVTGTSRTANEFAKKFHVELEARAGVQKEGYVLEVASNDGTFLRPFKEAGWKVLGVDPAENISEMAARSGIRTKCVFFGEAAANEIVKENSGTAWIVFARNVLPHVANTIDFTHGLRAALHEDGVLAIEAHYAKTILEELHYDSIYHEHLCYFTLKSLERLLNDSGLYVFDAVKSPTSGGSMVVYAKKKKVRERARVGELRAAETAARINELARWEEFAKRSFAHKDALNAMLRDAAGRGKVVAGWGASARSSTLLNFCGIDAKTISAIADLNPLKQGRFTAGTHIPINKAEEVMATNPRCMFILAWNFADEIMDALKNKFHYAGSAIIPLPNDPRLIRSL